LACFMSIPYDIDVDIIRVWHCRIAVVPVPKIPFNSVPD
jgi:hypothetical protein